MMLCAVSTCYRSLVLHLCRRSPMCCMARFCLLLVCLLLLLFIMHVPDARPPAGMPNTNGAKCFLDNYPLQDATQVSKILTNLAQ